MVFVSHSAYHRTPPTSKISIYYIKNLISFLLILCFCWESQCYFLPQHYFRGSACVVLPLVTSFSILLSGVSRRGCSSDGMVIVGFRVSRVDPIRAGAEFWVNLSFGVWFIVGFFFLLSVQPVSSLRTSFNVLSVDGEWEAAHGWNPNVLMGRYFMKVICEFVDRTFCLLWVCDFKT